VQAIHGGGGLSNLAVILQNNMDHANEAVAIV
jgi:hypothetical protein